MPVTPDDKRGGLKRKPIPVHIPTAAPPPPKRVPLPPLLDPVVTKARFSPPPKLVPVPAPQQSLRPAPKHSGGTEKRFYKPPVAGQKPDGYEPVAVRRGRAGIGAPHTTRPYWLGRRGTTKPLMGLTGRTGSVEDQKYLASLKEGGAFATVAEGIAHPVADLAHSPSLGGAASDVANITSYAITGPTAAAAHALAVASVGLHGTRAAREFVTALKEGMTVRDALKVGSVAIRDTSRARRAAVSAALVKDATPALRGSVSRAQIRAQIDMHATSPKQAEILKGELDDAAMAYADHEARALKGGTLAQRRAAKVAEYFQDVHPPEQGAHPIPDFPRVVEGSDKNLASFLRSEGQGAAQNDPMHSAHPLAGGHQAVGKINAAAWWARTQHAVGHDKDLGLSLAYWYRELGPMFQTFFGEDAPAILRGFAVSQANASPTGGLQNVLRVRDLILRGEPVPKDKISTVVGSIENALRGEEVSSGMAAKLHDFTNSLEGKGTRTWVGDDIRGGSPTAIDIHAQRDLGRIDPKILSTLRNRHGLPVAHLQLEVQERGLHALERTDVIQIGSRKIRSGEAGFAKAKADAIEKQRAEIKAFKRANRDEIKVGKRSGLILDNPSSSASGAAYDAPLREYQAITDHLNKIAAWGKTDWIPSEVQALGWSAIQRFHGKAPENALAAIEGNTFNLTVFNDAPATYRAALGLTKEMGARAEQIVSEEHGILRSVHYGPGSVEGNIVPTVLVRVIGPPEALDRIAARMSGELGVDVRLTRPGKSVTKTKLKPGSKFAIEVESPHFGKVRDAGRFWSRLQAAASDKERVHLTDFTPYSYVDDKGETIHGMRIITGHGSGSADQNAARLAKYGATLDAATEHLGYDVSVHPNNVEVRVHSGQGNLEAATPAGSPGEPAAASPVAEAVPGLDVAHPADVNPPLYDAATERAEARSDEETQAWQSSLADESGFLGVGREPRGLGERYQPRTLKSGDLSVQMPKARSTFTQRAIEMPSDRISVALDRSPWAHDTRGVRLLTATERATKYAGRAQRIEQNRRLAGMARAMKTLAKVKEGSAEDLATFWYAQLPASHRNGEGLALVRSKLEEELHRIATGEAAAELDNQLAGVRAAMREAENGEHWKLLKRMDEIKLLQKDLPFQADDITAAISKFDSLLADAPEVNTAALDALRTMAADRRRILVEGGRLDAERAAMREGLVARWLGLEPDGTEIYVGHRLPRPENKGGSFASSGGTGPVRSPQGTNTVNRLILAKQGRLRPSTRVAYEDWQSAQVFEQAIQARKDLGLMGVPYTGGSLKEGYVLVNPKGQTIPPHWKSDELAQFTDDSIERDEIRTKAKEVLQGFIADNNLDAEEMVRLAYQAGQPIGELRVVPQRLVERYYSQFRSFKSRGGPLKAYDMAVDGVVTSIVFARVGYIPKNMVQNLIMAVPHQGAFMLPNAIRAGQVLNDPYLRDLIRGEVAGTGATAALSREAASRKILGRATHIVTSLADDPVRIAAFLHEAAAEGVIPRTKLLLGPSDREALVRLLTQKSQRARLNDIRSRSVEAMADFTRMTPDQARAARRLLIIPGWLMAGSRYPFHFAATHPLRTVLLAYALAGEPGAPAELQFNQPVTHYFHGSRFLIGIDTRWGRLRTASLNPVSTPYDLGLAAEGSIRGKTGPFDYTTPTIFDEAQPLVKSIYGLTSGEGARKSLLPLVPDYKLIHDEAADLTGHGAGSPRYPDDGTWWRRLERETGVFPVKVNDVIPKKRRPSKARGKGSEPGFGSGDLGGGFGAPPSSVGFGNG